MSLVILALACTLLAGPATAAETLVRIAWLGPVDADAHRGARQGIAEANAQGRFLGWRYELLTVEDGADAAALGASALVADVAPLRLLKAAAQAPGMPVINVSRRENELREECLPQLFHTVPSDAMLEDALQQWRRKAPGSAAVPQAWHASMKKYAAAQLNQRYTETFGAPMTDPAWAAWAAVKLLSDTVARAQTADSSTLIEILKTDLAFDGQKGIDMSFRDTGQLRQPLLLVEDGRVVGEAPVRGIVGPTNLDSLGLTGCLK